MTRFAPVALLALLLTPLSGLAGPSETSIYRTTDEQGNVVFTDAPPANAGPVERVEVPPVNTATPPPSVRTPATAADSADKETQAASYSVTITSPADETSFPMGPGNFSVNATVAPSPGGSARLQLFIDGAPWGEPQQSTTWALTNVFRGQHDLTVGVIDASGAQLAGSPPIRVFVHRPSINFRNR